MKIVFMGTPDFSCGVLQALIDSKHEVIASVTQPDKAKDRGNKVQYTPVKALSLENGITVLQPEKIRGNDDFMAQMRTLAPDVIVVVAYGKILPKELLDLPRLGCVNVHASLLPRLRGASPIQHAIILGEEKTGVTIMQMDVGMDTGDMLLKDEVEIGSMNYEQLHDKLADMGSNLIVEAIDKLDEGKIVPEKQDDSKATYCGMITKQDGEIDFNKSAVSIERLIRGFDPWPGAYCNMESNGKPLQLKLWKASVVDKDRKNNEPGKITSVDSNGFTVDCGIGSLYVTEIQVPGKKRVQVKDYLLGHKVEIGTLLKGK